MLYVKWNDNSSVTVASNYGVNPIHQVQRRVKKENRKLVYLPHLIHMYNKGMGGVYVCVRMLSSYRPRLRSKKWWWNIFSTILNLAMVAAFRFYEHIDGSVGMSHIMFRRETARPMIKFQEERKRLGGPSAQPAKAVRYDGVNHFLEPCTIGRNCLCMKNTRLHCTKCGKRRHKVCNSVYHKK